MDTPIECHCSPIPACIFCLYPKIDGYEYGSNLSLQHLCPNCSLSRQRTFHFHTRCAQVARWKTNNKANAFSKMITHLVAAMPLDHPSEDVHSSFASYSNRLKILIPGLSRLPTEVVMNIWSNLNPCPEMIAFLRMEIVSKVFGSSSQPHLISVRYPRPGFSLRLKYGEFVGKFYLLNPGARKYDREKIIRFEDEMVICRDHFAVTDILSINQSLQSTTGPQTVHYQHINLRHLAVEHAEIQGVSDVSQQGLHLLPSRHQKLK